MAENQIADGRTLAREKFDDKFIETLDRDLAKASLKDKGWRDRDDIDEVMTRLQRFAHSEPAKAVTMWDKHRPNDPDKPQFIDNDDKGPEVKDEPKVSAKAVDPVEEKLRKRYLVTDQNKYHLRDRNNEIAFEDKGNTLTTKLNDPDIIASMIDLAQSKGWQTLKIDGSKEFKAEAWLQAAARGIDVKGHEPSPLDLAKLTDLKLEETRAKAVTDRPKTASQTHAKDDDPPKSKEERYALETIKTIMQSRGDTDEAIAMAQKVVSDRLTNNRVYVGEIKDIGTAPFDNDPKEKKTPFVTLATHDGDKQIWGVDLPRAIEEGKVKIGDRVTLTNEGKQPVQVNVDKYDDKGAKTTVVETVNRNTWKIQNLETIRDEVKKQVEASSRSGDSQPKVRVIDRTTQPPQPSRPDQAKDHNKDKDLVR